VPTERWPEIAPTRDSTEVRTQLFRHFTPSPTRVWSVDPGPVYVATTARQAILRVVLDGSGPFTICHR
jgi:hypothetical protein